jgi:Hypothetical glycosyl hydrolase family 15
MSDTDRKLLTTRRAFLLAGAAAVAGVGAWDLAGLLDQRSEQAAAVAEASAQRAAATAAEARLLTFPRTGTYFLGQDRLPSNTTLAQYDLVVISHEWPHRVPADFFTGLRAANPRMKLLGYVDLVDSMSQLGTAAYWPESYALWQFTTSTESRFPRAWLAHTATGVPVHEYQDSVMTNLTDGCPRVGGQRFVDYAADWVTRRVWATRVWDGFFLDVWADRLWTVDQNAWDITGTGTNVPNTRIFGPGNPLDQGLTSGERTMRSRMPGSILVANGTRTLHQGLQPGVLQRSQPLPDQRHRDPAVAGVFQQVEHPDGLVPVGVGQIAAAQGHHERGLRGGPGTARVQRAGGQRRGVVGRDPNRCRAPQGHPEQLATGATQPVRKLLALDPQTQPGQHDRAHQARAEPSGQPLGPGERPPRIEVEDRDALGEREVGPQQARGVGEHGDPRAGPPLAQPVEGDGEHGQVAVVAQPVLAVLDQDPQRAAGLVGFHVQMSRQPRSLIPEPAATLAPGDLPGGSRYQSAGGVGQVMAKGPRPNHQGD